MNLFGHKEKKQQETEVTKCFKVKSSGPADMETERVEAKAEQIKSKASNLKEDVVDKFDRAAEVAEQHAIKVRQQASAARQEFEREAREAAERAEQIRRELESKSGKAQEKANEEMNYYLQKAAKAQDQAEQYRRELAQSAEQKIENVNEQLHGLRERAPLEGQWKTIETTEKEVTKHSAGQFEPQKENVNTNNNTNGHQQQIPRQTDIVTKQSETLESVDNSVNEKVKQMHISPVQTTTNNGAVTEPAPEPPVPGSLSQPPMSLPHLKVPTGPDHSHVSDSTAVPGSAI